MKRILITVNGGVADYIADHGVEVVIYDFDNIDTLPEAERKNTRVPAGFADLAEVVGVPYETEEV